MFVRALLLDLDGTLVDSTPAVDRCWRRWCGEHGVDPTGLADFHGLRSADAVAAVLPPERVGPALERLDELELADLDDVVALPGAAEVLAAGGDRAAIVTSAGRALAGKRLAAAGLRPPRVMVTADDVARGKPDPEPHLAAARLLDVPAEDCLVVEDAAAGVAAARAAGMRSVGVGTNPDVGALPADLVVSTLAELRWLPRDGGVEVVRR
ncbi:HAD-IA family hydrolase [Actinoalloteichus spitiensis]|uniref:HAD-IA family hydrolase n=1 Tax=Actinoalloteichus spitiensis TaxID=252394 RepID=UPI000474C863|nr:HAD-IA family hydrolase [Actinoalloteichus spitiensis]